MTADLPVPDRQDHLRPVPDEPDDGAFARVYTEHFDRLRRFVLGLTGQASLAEDIAQETLLRAYTRMETFDLNRPLWPWLKCVAMRLVVDNGRSHSRESLDPDPVVETATDSFDVTVERQLLSEALQLLPTRQRVALGLRYLENWKSSEVAAVLGLSRSAVEQLLLRGRRRLSAEYLALGGNTTSGFRAALWPLVFVIARLRDRAYRLRQYLTGTVGGQLPAAVDSMTQMVAAATLGGVLFAGGVALAAPTQAPTPTKAELFTQDASAFHSKQLRVPIAPVAVAPRTGRTVAPGPQPSAPARQDSAPAATADGPTSAPAEAAPEVTKVEVSTAAPVKEAPASSVAEASKQRTDDDTTVRVSIRSEIARALAPAGGVGAVVNCSTGMVAKATCEALDAGEASAELP